MTQQQFALRLGINQGFLSRLCAQDPNKQRHPSLALAQRIRDLTNGQVRVADWPTFAEIADAVHADKPAPACPPVQGKQSSATVSSDPASAE